MSAVTTSTLATRLAAYRERAKLSQAKLAAKADRSPATIWDIENGRQTNPQIETLEDIARALSEALGAPVTVADLRGPIESEPAPAKVVGE